MLPGSLNYTQIFQVCFCDFEKPWIMVGQKSTCRLEFKDVTNDLIPREDTEVDHSGRVWEEGENKRR